MRNRTLAVLTAVTGLLLTPVLAGTASAARPTTPTSGVHFTQAGDPSCTLVIDSATGAASADCTSEVAGLGQGEVTVTATISALATYTCRNRGGNEAPGQNNVAGPAVGVDSPTKFTPADDNGRTTLFDSSGPATVEPTVSGTRAGCPNGNWTGVNPVIIGYHVTFEATQGGVLLFCREGDATDAGAITLVACTDGGGVVR